MKEKTKNISKKYLDNLKSVMDSVYNETPFPLLAHYANAVAKKMNLEARENNGTDTDKNNQKAKELLYSGAQIHKPIKTAINELIKTGLMVSEEHGKRTCFYPNNEKYRLYKFSKELTENIRLAKNDIHKFTDDTFVIALENANESKAAIKTLTDFIGADHCYHVANISDSLILVIVCGFTKLECAKCIAQISELVKTSYDIQHKPIIPEDPFAKARRIKREKNRQAKKEALFSAQKPNEQPNKAHNQ